MNELCNTTNSAVKVRKALLTTVSALAVAAYGGSSQASDSDRPTVWIEGGWHFESIIGESDPFVPPLDSYNRATGLTSLTTLEKALGRTYGAEGSITFQPTGSDWVFAVSGRYGRVHTTRRIADQKTIVGAQMQKFGVNGVLDNGPFTPTLVAYAEGSSSNSEAHAILDFEVGKDIGIGLLGSGTDSIISFGVRYAQMNAKSKANFYARPDARFEQFIFSNKYGNPKYGIHTYSHNSAASAIHTDSVQAVGPSVSLKNVTGLWGTLDGGQFALDWGVNAGFLFGRQKAKISHHSAVRYYGHQVTHQTYPAVTRSRSRMVIIPNIGGFAGLSYRFTNAKISAGYRADFFFGAKDSGLETRNTVDVGFHGPYATISIGFGG